MAKCPICKHPAELRINLKLFCSFDCAAKWGKAQAEKAKAKKVAEQKRKDKATLSKHKSQTEWAGEVQPVFNKMRRLECLLWFKVRGLEPVCISCQKPIGGDIWACGHNKTRKARPDLAFERLNAHLQHNFSCNSHKSGDTEGQKKGYAMIYGEQEAAKILADLEIRRESKKRTPEEWQAMKKEYNSEIRRLQAVLVD